MYIAYRSVSRGELIEAHDYDERTARDIFVHYPTVNKIDFCRPSDNSSSTRYAPEPGVIIYVKATSGSYGKPKRQITHPDDRRKYEPVL